MATNSLSITKEVKCQVTIVMAKKWQTKYKRECQSLTWLNYNVDNKDKTLVKFCSKALALGLARSSTVSFAGWRTIPVWGLLNQLQLCNHRASNATDQCR